MSISTYIFVHDQNIILDCDSSGKFKSLPNVQYVFLGVGDTEEIKGRSDVIIARDLPNNIEQYPKFCSFTGWYALWKNNLIQSEYVHLFEYDITLENNFNTRIDNILNDKYDFIGYAPLSMQLSFVSPQYLANILPAIQKHYNVNMQEIIDKIYNQNKKSKWSSTSNSTFSIEAFIQYMNWFEKLIDDLKNNKMCGHAHERSITFFYLLFNKKICLENNLIKHSMLDSHGTGEVKRR